MGNPDDAGQVEASVLLVLSAGLGGAAVVLAGLAVFLLLHKQGYLTRTKSRSTRITHSPDSEMSTR
ncbi:hypothetical protein N9C74_00365 [Pontimonas sp.]|nr:hypothetical protein [Microbacteriaceae bacterium]MDA9786473.1 hypothetical protein [Pontimonas sp.]